MQEEKSLRPRGLHRTLWACWWLSAPVLIGWLTIPALAQNYELGVGAGLGVYNDATVSGPAGQAEAGFNNSFAGSAWVSHDMYRRLGGEFRYTFGNNNLKLGSGGSRATMSAETHTIHYELQVHFADRDARTRAFVAIGGGAKRYTGKGPEQAFQPLSGVAVLTKTSQWVGVVAFGGGVKVRVGSNGMFRAEVRDYWSPVPTQVIAPAPGANLGGWIHNIVPLVGFGFRF